MSAADSAATPLRRLGVMGGMFDPIHLGHVAAATHVQRALGLEEVLLVPCGHPVHRREGLASGPQRCAMVKLAIASESRLQLDQRECQSAAGSYTIDTLEALRSVHANVSWHLLVGIDAFLGLPTWKEWQRLLDLCNLVVMTRGGHVLDEAKLAPELLAQWQRRRVVDVTALEAKASGALITIDVKTADISSTKVRELIKTGGDLGSILHAAVARHIRSHGLYLPGDQD